MFYENTEEAEHAREPPAGTDYHHCDLPELGEHNSVHILVSR